MNKNIRRIYRAALKMKVAREPHLLGLPRKSKSETEHGFESKDEADVLFNLPNGDAAVVEIKTDYDLLSGIYQAIKYRSLLAVERGEPLSTTHIKAFLVAHSFDNESDIQKLARKYKIKLVSLQA